VRVYLGRGADGKRQYQNKTIRGVKKDAQTWLTATLGKKDRGIPTFETKVTLGKFLSEWLETVAKARVGERTFDGYESLLKYAKDAIGSVRVAALRPSDVQRFYSTLSPSTARHVHAPLRSALNQAVKWGLIYSNPCDAVALPRHRAREMYSFTREEAARLLAVETKHRVLFAFLLTSGARPSEALGMKWSDIDFERATATIQRTLQWHKGKGAGWYFSEPKTKGSRRSVPLPASLMRQLREHRTTQAEALLKLGIRSDLVFSNREGTPLLRRNIIRRYFRPVLEKANLPATARLYDLRHTCASLLLQAGVHPKIVSERLGHASVTLTLDVYSHVMPGMQEDATIQLEQLLYG
jgi:integrase